MWRFCDQLTSLSHPLNVQYNSVSEGLPNRGALILGRPDTSQTAQRCLVSNQIHSGPVQLV